MSGASDWNLRVVESDEDRFDLSRIRWKPPVESDPYMDHSQEKETKENLFDEAWAQVAAAAAAAAGATEATEGVAATATGA